MATDGCILKAVKPLTPRPSVSHGIGTGADYLARFESAGKGAIRNIASPKSDAISETDSWRRSGSAAPAAQASLLYLSLTGCCAAQAFRTIGPRGTTTGQNPKRDSSRLPPFRSSPASWRSRGQGPQMP